MEVRVKRVYDDASDADGYRVLVDRLWPRGLTKERAAVDLWVKEVAPSAELRKAFHHGGLDHATFTARYEAEMDSNPAVAALRESLREHDVVTLLHAMNDAEHNHALLLRERLV